MQNEIKIKEEPIDATMNTDESEDYVLNKTNSKISHEEALSNHNLHGNKENEAISDICSAHVENVKKSFNLKRKSTETKDSQIADNLPIPKKKRKYFNEKFNENVCTLRKSIIKNFQRRTKRKCVMLNSKMKLENERKEEITCDICFREFSSVTNCVQHKHYYEYVGNFKCNRCKKRFTTREKLNSHFIIHHRKGVIKNCNNKYPTLHCNFCDRFYREKIFLQSHLFHMHRQLVCQKNITKTDNFKIKNLASADTSRANNDLPSKRKESLHSDSITAKSDIILMKSANKLLNEDKMQTEDLMTENSRKTELTSMKQLRQPTIEEYLELRKKKRNVMPTSNKLPMLRDHPSPIASHHNDEKIKENIKPNVSEKANGQPSSPGKQRNSSSEQVACSAVEQSKKNEVCLAKRPFVKLHADVEMMKSFLDKLPTIKHEENEDGTNGTFRYDRAVPYRLRSLKDVSSPKTNMNLRKQSTNVSKKSQLNTEHTRSAPNIIDKVDSSYKKIITAYFKCKDCIIPIKRCDDNTNTNKESVVDITSQNHESPTIPCDPTSSQDSNVQDEGLNELEISLKPLATDPVADTIAMEIESIKEENLESRFSCKICETTFPSKSAKREHIKSLHIAYMSSICNARYTIKSKLLQHYLHEHRAKQNQCCVCFILFPNFMELKQHLYVHCLRYVQKKNDQYPIDVEVKCKLSKQEYKCLQCNMIFPSQSSLQMHHGCCLIQNKIDNQNDCIKEMNSLSEIIFKMPPTENDEMVPDKQDDTISPTQSFDEYSNNNKDFEETPSNRWTSISEEQLKVTEDNKKFVNGHSSVVEAVGTVNKQQGLSEDNTPTNKDQDIAQTQLDSIDSKTLYPCNVCGKQFHNEKNLQQHIRTFSSVDICPICSTAFGSKRLLQTHVTAAHVPEISKNYNFHCMFCNQGFVKRHELRPHVLHLHGQQMLNTLSSDSVVTPEKSGTPIFSSTTCNVCNLVFETWGRYVEHTMYYYEKHTFMCSLCAQNFQGMYMFNHHNKLVHYSEDKRKSYSYNCEICKEGFNHESHFHSHNMHVHSNKETEVVKESKGKSQFEEIVNEQNKIINLFLETTKAKQKKEIKQVSSEYVCHICQIKCINSDDLIKHKAFYSNDGDFKCDKCNRQCRTLEILTQHKQLTHMYRDIFSGHVCQHCGEILETITSLSYHEKHFHLDINVSDNNKTVNQLSLVINQSSLNTTSTQQQSESTNSKDSEYKCLICNMKFSSLDVIKIHIIKTHISSLLIKNASKSTSSSIPDTNVQKKLVPQQTKADQISSDNNNSTPHFQQGDSILKVTLLDNKTKNTTIINSPNTIKAAIPTSSMVPWKTSTPTIIKKSDIISTSTVSTLHKESSINTSVPTCIQSMYSRQTTNRILSKPNSANQPTIPINPSMNNAYKPLFVISPLQLIPMNPNTTNPKIIPANHSYTCPLCPLEYPSLLFFHAHMRYAHAHSIRANRKNPQSDQETSVIECLLCPCVFIDETKYQKHLNDSHSHYIYMPNSETRTITNDTRDTVKTTVDNNKRSSNPEVIVIDDDNDDCNADYSIIEVVSATDTFAHQQQNDKIGKLKVKSFAKFTENVSTDAMRYPQSK